MKDNFSSQAQLYVSFRPHYPPALYEYLLLHVKHFETAFDAATGNGQVAAILATKFKEVHATDISEKQLAYAPQLPNVFYKTEKAEQTSFADSYFDLVTVAQAIHWFDFEQFYAEVKRILKPGGLFAAIGYSLVRTNRKIDAWTDHFYQNITGPYWDKERKYIDEAYATIPFPFNEIAGPSLTMEYQWSKDQFIGYLTTWSAVQHYIKAKNTHPLTDELLQQLNNVWPQGTLQTVRFPLLLRAGHR